jgi:hypothetical protein
MLENYPHIAAAYEKYAPPCSNCGAATMTFLLKLGRSILWDCTCGSQKSESVRKFVARIQPKKSSSQEDQNEHA